MENKVNNIVLKKILIVFLALVGFLTTIKLALIYYDSNFNPYALPSFCSVNEFIDCDGVAHTTHSQFFGIPLAYWGMFLYMFIIFLVFVDKIKNIKFWGFLEVFKNPLDYISALGFISFAISMVLAGISIFEIHKLCILCFFTYFLNLLIATVATDFEKGIYNSFKQSVLDFFGALKEKKYLISFASLAVLAVCVLAYTEISDIFCPQIKRIKEFKHYEKLIKNNPFGVTGNILGDKDAKLIVYLYTDYQCPICKTYNVMVQRAAKELGGFKFVHKNLPLDSECNKNLREAFHESSCLMSRYAIASEKQGRFWDFNNELFEKEPKTEDAILKMAKEEGYDTKQLKIDANSELTKAKLNGDIDDSMTNSIDGTPALIINGKVYAGIKPYYELKKILMEAGAFERKDQ